MATQQTISAAASQPAAFTPEELEWARLNFGTGGEVRALPLAPGYAVAGDGRVFSKRPCRRCTKAAGAIREMRLTRTGAGYLMVRFQVGGKQTADSVHRLVASVFLPPPAAGQRVVRHLDGDPENNRAGNLAWGTDADNMNDMIRHGRTLKGRKNPNAKLTDRRARLVRELCEEGFASDIVAHMFGLVRATVQRIAAGESWVDA